MAQQFAARDGRIVVEKLIDVIKENRTYLSEVDGAIGDGDHGINMAKGFSLAAGRLSPEMGLAEGLKTLGSTLIMDIGGAMGPLYGTFFKAMARSVKDRERIDAEAFADMIEAALRAVVDLGGAKPGDKTLVDALQPAVEAFRGSIGDGFAAALAAMAAAAEEGKERTRDLVARLGRASRLGERSRGSLDAGATSCWLILRSMADTVRTLL